MLAKKHKNPGEEQRQGVRLCCHLSPQAYKRTLVRQAYTQQALGSTPYSVTKLPALRQRARLAVANWLGAVIQWG